MPLLPFSHSGAKWAHGAGGGATSQGRRVMWLIWRGMFKVVFLGPKTGGLILGFWEDLSSFSVFTRCSMKSAMDNLGSNEVGVIHERDKGRWLGMVGFGLSISRMIPPRGECRVPRSSGERF